MIRVKSKPSSPKASKPKTSQPKASAPKASAPKVGPAKAAAPKVSAAKASTPKAAAPAVKVSAAKAVAPKVSAPKALAPKVAAAAPKPAALAPKAAAPAPKLAAPAPKALAAKVSAVKAPAPKATKAAAPVPATPPQKAKPSKAAAQAVAGAKPVAAKVVRDTPAKLRPIEQAVGVSSDAVARRTGKSWAEWFALLDAAGAEGLDHKGIVAVLAQRHGVGPWWQQMVTVAYEKARGMREHQESDDGFQAGISKTLELPLAKLFRFWAEPAERNKWLADDRFSIHKATASKSIRARWGRGVSRIDVDFCEKGPSKSQVTVQHNRIETSDAAEQMKAYWAKKIRALEALLSRP